MMSLACWMLLASFQPADSSVVLRGLLAADENSQWVLALPQPMVFGGRRVGRIALRGDANRWSRYDRFYVEVRGTLVAEQDTLQLPYLNLTAVKEVQPEGIARGEVSTSFSQRVAMTLYVLPRSFHWRNNDGSTTGVGPVVVYTLNNHGQSRLTLGFDSKDYVCFQVQKQYGSQVWEFARQFAQPNSQQEVTLPPFVREMVELPENAASTPGKYRVRAGLCGYREYQLEAEIDVLG